MVKKFLRRDREKYPKFKRKKKLKWKRPVGKDNKMRLRRRNYPLTVEVGYKKSKKEKIPVIRNLGQLGEGKEVIISGKVGKKKRKQIEEEAKKKGIKILNKKQKENESEK